MHNVAIIDDHPVILAGLKTLIGQSPMIRVTGIHQRSPTFLMALHSAPHHTVIVDYKLHGDDITGEELIRLICQRWPAVNVIVLSAFNDAKVVRDCLRAGALAVLCKSAPLSKLSEQLRAVLLT